MTQDNKQYKVVEQANGSLRFELVNPFGQVVAVFRTLAQAQASCEACNRPVDDLFSKPWPR